MGALAAPFILCPLAEIKDLVGFSPDKEENQVIVTLGKNIAIRYAVSEQKQEVSWTSSSHWFTSKVVFCSDLNKYGAVIDNNSIGLWDEADSNMMDLKKFKVSQPLFGIIPSTIFGSFVVFENGSIISLEAIVLGRRFRDIKSTIDVETEIILDVYVDEIKSLIFVCAGSKLSQENNVKIRSRIGVEKRSDLTIYTWRVGDEFNLVSKTQLRPPVRHKILGWCMISTDDCRILYLCSDGNLISKSLLRTVDNKDDGTTRAGDLGKYVSVSNPVVLCAYDETVICYGSNKSEEGGVVFLYDLKYNLVLSRHTLKLYSLPPIMTIVCNNALIPLGLNLLVVGIRVCKSLLSTVVGRNQIHGSDVFEMRDPWKHGWEQKNSVKPIQKNVIVEDVHDALYDGIDREDLQQVVNILEKNGHPEALICAQVIPQALEKGDETTLEWILEYFDEIPERFLVQLLPSALAACGTKISQQDLASSNKSEEILINILNRTFDQREMVKCLRNLPYDHSQRLLMVLGHVLESHLLPEQENTVNGKQLLLSRIMEWAGSVLDAHYAQLVFRGELESIETLLGIINDKMLLMKEVEGLAPLVDIFVNKARYAPRPDPKSLYRVESVIFR